MVTAKDFTSVGEGWTGELPDICTVEEVAAYLRETTSSVRIMTKRGVFPNAWRAHKGYRIPRTDVLAYTEKMYGQRHTGRSKDDHSDTDAHNTASD